MQYSEQVNKLILDGFSSQFLDFRQNIHSRDVASKKLTPLSIEFPVQGMDFETLDTFIKNKVQPSLSASNGGRY